MDKVYKLGIIGFGGMAHHHKTELHDKKFDRVKIHGIYDINPEKKEEVLFFLLCSATVRGCKSSPF